MDEIATRQHFETALQTHEPGFGTFFLARMLGLDVSYTADACIVEFPVRDFMLNPQGSLHGGVIATVMDISMGHLVVHATGAGAATLELKVQYLRAVTGGCLRAEGRFLRQGRRVGFMESRMSDETGTLVAVATGTWAMPRR